MQKFALSNTAGAKTASTDAIAQAGTVPAAATAAQLNTEALTQAAASITRQAAVTYSSASSRSEAEHNYVKEINKGCVNNTTFVPEGLLPHIQKNEIPKALKKEKTLDHIVRALHSKHEPPSIAMQAAPSDDDFYDDFEVIDNNSPMENAKSTQENSCLLKVHAPASGDGFGTLNSEPQYLQQDKGDVTMTIDPIMTSPKQKTNQLDNLASNKLLNSSIGAKGQLLQNILLRSVQLSSYMRKEQNLAGNEKANNPIISKMLESNQSTQHFNNTTPKPNPIYINLHYDENMDKTLIDNSKTKDHQASNPHTATIPNNDSVKTTKEMDITPLTVHQWKTGKEKKEVKKYRKYLSPVPSYSSLFADKHIAQPAIRTIPKGHSDAGTLAQATPHTTRTDRAAAVVGGAKIYTQEAPPGAKAAAAAAVLAAARTAGKEIAVHPTRNCIDLTTRQNRPNMAVATAAAALKTSADDQRQSDMIGIVHGAPSGIEPAASAMAAPDSGWKTRLQVNDNHLPAGMASAAKMADGNRQTISDTGSTYVRMPQTSAQDAPPTRVAHEGREMNNLFRPTSNDTDGAFMQMAVPSAQDAPPTIVAHEAIKLNHSCDSLYSHPSTTKSTRYSPGSHPLKMLPWEAKDKHPLEIQKAMYIKDTKRCARPGRPPFTMDPDGTMAKILDQMTTKVRKVEKDMYGGEISKTQEEFCMMIDEYVNTIHELNDHKIRGQGIEIIPFYMSDKNAPPNLFLGSFTAQKPDYRQFWFCKPCDLIAFRKTNFRHHHMCETHIENLQVWTIQMMASLNLGNTTPNKQEEQIEQHLDSHFQENKTSISDHQVKGRIFMEPPGLPKMEFPPINKDTQIMDKSMPILETLDYDPALDPQNKERTMPDLKRMDIQEPSKINIEIDATQSSKRDHPAHDFTLTLMDYTPEQKSQNQEKIMQDIRRIDPQDSKETINPQSTKENYLQDFSSTLRIINGTIPTKHKGDTIKLLSRFFNNQMGKNQKVNFIKDFLENQDDQRRSHWIVEKFQTLKKRNDLRLYLQQKWFTRQTITKKTMEQKEEIKTITDLARKLLDIFIDCSIVPTNYLTILAIIANNNEYLPCPESATSLSNTFCLDLFLNPGTIIVMENPPDISKLMTKTHIGSNIHPIDGIQPIQNYSLQDTILQIPLMEDISKNRKEPTISPPNTDPKEEAETNIPSTSFKKKESTNHHMMYLSNIKKGTSKKDLSRLLEDYGNIKKVIKERPDDMEAVIYFYNDDDLHNTIAQVNGQEFKGRRLKAQITRKVTSPIAIEERADKLSLKSSRSLLTNHIQKFRIIPGSRPTPIHWKKKALNLEERRKPIKMTLKRMEGTQQDINDLQRFFRESFQIKTIHDIRILPKTTVRFAAKLLRTRDPDIIIQDCQVTLTCGPPPFFQIMEGTYDVKNSILSPSIRNNSSTNILINKDTIIQGTTCHMGKYTQDQILTMQGKTQQEKQAGYHIQAKIYHRMNYIDNIAMRINTQENHGLEPDDTNPWDMDTN